MIDPTFIQFVRKDNTKLVYLDIWPSDKINDKDFIHDLVESGVSLIDDDRFQQYINSFSPIMLKYNLDDYIMSDNLENLKWCKVLSNLCKLLVVFINTVYYKNREGDIVIYPSIDKILNIIDSKYELVHIISQRSKQMAKTEYYQMPEYKYVSKKNLGRALEEIENNLIIVKKD